jgi:hypothetical protein
MKTILLVAALLAAPVVAYSQTKKCDDLKAEIAAKLDAKGVKGYSLDIVDKDKDAGEAKVVGTCEGGSKKILYSKSGVAAEAPAKDTTKQ